MPDRVAVVGMSIRAAEVRDTTDFWRLVSAGRSGRREFSPQELARRGVPDRRYKDPAYVPVAYPMADPLGFDAPAFGFSPAEAELTDPQHRVIMQACYRAVESAGSFIGALPDRVGVFLGARASHYGALLEAHGDGLLDPTAIGIGTDPDYMSSRISYAFGLTGPAMTVLTACSSSSVAVHLACQAILAGECDSALAGGVAVNVRDAGYLYTEGGIYSPRGRCQPYMTSADGTVDGNGVAVVFLRRLDAALAAGDPILGVIVGTAVNNDGRERAGFGAPGVAGQADLIEEVLDVAEVPAARIGLLEGHGTGTSIGDILEIDAATKAYRSAGARPGGCRLHSVKANVGNLTAAGGVAGIITGLLAMRHGEIPPNAPLVAGASPVDLRGTPFTLAERPLAWPRSAQGRYAAISSFGLGGTNAHVIIGDAEPELRTAARRGRSWQLLPLSADDPERLSATVDAVRAAVADASADTRQDIGHTLRTGRPELRARTAALVPVRGDADARWPDPAHVRHTPDMPPPLVLLLPGEDTPPSAAALALYRAEPVIRASVDDGLAALQTALDPETYAAVRAAFLHGEPPTSTRTRQPVLHLLGVAQHAFLDSLGIRPDVLVGYGVGELTAAQLGGVLSTEDGARAVCWRSQAGAQETMVRLTRQLRELRLVPPTTPTVSGATGSWLNAEEACDPGYWGVQLRERVPAEDAVSTVAAEHPAAVYLALSGGTDLLDAVRRSGPAPEAALVLAPDSELPEVSLLHTVAGLWERGVRVNWDAYAEHDHGSRIDVAPREFARTAHLHPALLDHCPGIDPAELAGKRDDR